MVALGTETEAGAVERLATLRGAFKELFRLYHPVIFAAAYNRLSNRGDAEDAAAEVFSAAWRLRANAASVFTLPWLYGTLRNVVGNEYRRRNRSAARVDKAVETVVGHAHNTTSDDHARDVRRAILTLPMNERELIWMVYWEELTGDEMASIVGCSHAALRVRLHRAKRRLRSALEMIDTTHAEGGTP